MRTTLAALALLAATAMPAAADPQDPLGLCPTLPRDWPVGAVCAHFDPEISHFWVVPCSATDVEHPDGTWTYIFSNATVYAPYAAEITTLCWQAGIYGLQIVPGPASVFGPQRFPGMANPGGSNVCTQFRFRFQPGNPHGHDPNVQYQSDVICLD